MSDETNPPATPPAPPTAQPQPWIMQASTDQMLVAREHAVAQKMLKAHDDARAAAPQVTLICVAGFTMVTDEYPDGFVINPGDEFTISEFDLPRYLGRGWFKREDPRHSATRG